jgi:hypothetical protein
MNDPVGIVPPLTVMTVNTHNGFTTFNRAHDMLWREAGLKVDHAPLAAEIHL